LLKTVPPQFDRNSFFLVRNIEEYPNNYPEYYEMLQFENKLDLDIYQTKIERAFDETIDDFGLLHMKKYGNRYISKMESTQLIDVLMPLEKTQATRRNRLENDLLVYRSLRRRNVIDYRYAGDESDGDFFYEDLSTSDYNFYFTRILIPDVAFIGSTEWGTYWDYSTSSIPEIFMKDYNNKID
jgi:hypothetical protein